MSAFWDIYHSQNNTKYKFTEEISFVVNAIKPKSILEVGCGFGFNLAILSNEIKRVGLDISELALNEAKNHTDIAFYNYSILDDNANFYGFDLVFTSTVLGHLPLAKIDECLVKLLGMSNEFVMNIEAYDINGIERPIDWWRKYEFNTLNLKQRYEKLGIKILMDMPLDNEYKLTLCQKL